MTKYQDSFKLDVEDIEIIEQALRQKISREIRGDGNIGSVTLQPSSNAVRKIQCVLGKIHNQKRFYSTVNPGSCPLG